MQAGKGIEIEKIREVRRQEDWKEEAYGQEGHKQ
jgi:hypothetical protein